VTQLPTNRTAANTVAEHVADHNTLASEHNVLDGHTGDAAAHATAIATAITAVIDAAPGTLDTLNELAAALGDDANFASTVTTALAGKSATGHAHTESDVTSLVSDLAGKASTAHHTAHEPSGSDPMAVDAAAGTGSLRTLGTGAAQAAAGNDSRLSDTRTPSALSVTNAMVSATAAIAKSKLAALAIVNADVDAAAAIVESKLSLASDAAAGTASRRTLGTGAAQAAAGNHAHSGTYVAAVATKTTAYAAVAGDVILADATSAPLTVTLPVPSLNALVTVKKVDASTNNVTIARHASETIDGGASAALAVRYASVDVISNGTDWFVI